MQENMILRSQSTDLQGISMYFHKPNFLDYFHLIGEYKSKSTQALKHAIDRRFQHFPSQEC